MRLLEKIVNDPNLLRYEFQKLYHGCDSIWNPLFYQIKPSGTFDISEDRDITEKDFKKK